MKRIILLLVMVALAAIAVPAAFAGGNENGPPPVASAYCVDGSMSVPAVIKFDGGSLNFGFNQAAAAVKYAHGDFYAGVLQGTDIAVALNGLVDPDEYLEPGYTAHHVDEGTCPAPGVPYVALPVRGLYCAVTSNKHPFTGAAIPAGKALDLLAGQPGGKNSSYAGATPANYVEGVGLTCDAPPAGYVRKGTAGDPQHVSSEPLYPLWVKGG